MNLEDVKKKLELAFSNDEHEIQIEHTVEADYSKDAVTVTIPNPGEETAYASQVLESYGFVPVPELFRNSEIASAGGLQYTNDPKVKEEMYEGDANVEMAEALSDDDEADEIASLFVENDKATLTVTGNGNISIRARGKVNVKAANSVGEVARSLDSISDESLLKVLGSPEMMKTANKLYDIIAPGEDKSTYAAFLYNFDDFLLMHKPDIGDYEESDDDEDDGVDDIPPVVAEGASAEEAAVDKKDYNLLVKMFGDIETAAMFVSGVELAKSKKQKKGRSAVLSHLMKGMSGENGIDAINAFEANNKAAFEAAMQKVVARMAEALEDNSKSDKPDEE